MSRLIAVLFLFLAASASGGDDMLSQWGLKLVVNTKPKEIKGEAGVVTCVVKLGHLVVVFPLRDGDPTYCYASVGGVYLEKSK